ncbi:MAG: uracil-DNA glycosylase [Alphaproteobacteria bacterium]|nr:uracil-DNA glycosylase [Alphaproteobacteria bacterium]
MTLGNVRDELVELLAWYGELGVDCAVADEAVDWLRHGDVAPGAAVRQALRAAPNSRSPETGAERVGGGQTSRRAEAPPGFEVQRRSGKAATGSAANPTASAAAAQAASGLRQTAAGAGGQGASEARRLAEEAKTLEQLRLGLEEFEGCSLRATAKNTCFYRGAETARLMIIGEAPGRDEDLAGKPFVGRAGKLLDLMLAAIGIGESDVHITNVVYWRPPGNRTPTLQETESCRPFLERQVQLVAPEFVLLTGGAAAKSVLETTEGIMRLRGKWKELKIGGHHVRALPTLHPAYLLRTPAAKRQAWRDLLMLRKALD